MAKAYLEQESIREGARRRKLFLGAFIFFSCVSALLYFAVGDSIDLSDPEDKSYLSYLPLWRGLCCFARQSNC